MYRLNGIENNSNFLLSPAHLVLFKSLPCCYLKGVLILRSPKIFLGNNIGTSSVRELMEQRAKFLCACGFQIGCECLSILAPRSVISISSCCSCSLIIVCLSRRGVVACCSTSNCCAKQRWKSMRVHSPQLGSTLPQKPVCTSGWMRCGAKCPN